MNPDVPTMADWLAEEDSRTCRVRRWRGDYEIRISDEEGWDYDGEGQTEDAAFAAAWRKREAHIERARGAA